MIVKNIAVITHPLMNNYGGLLQNYALQKVVAAIGADSKTIDCLQITVSPLYVYIASWIKSFLFLFIPGKKRKFVRYTSRGKRHAWSDAFVRQHISVTQSCIKYDLSSLKDYDAVM